MNKILRSSGSEMTAGMASAMASLSNSWLKARAQKLEESEYKDLKARITALEKQQRAVKNGHR